MTRTLKDIERIAKEKGWCVNSDEKTIENVLKAMNMKKEKFGDYYCPCRLQRVPDNICPCVFAESEIKKDGLCHCRLYSKCN